MKQFVTNLVTTYARQAIERYQPKVVGVTGSQGKTSVRLAVATVLKSSGVSVRTPAKNYNNEIGFPLGILGMTSPGKSSLGWLKLLREARRVARGKDPQFPKVLVLEYGVDKTGDMKHLLSMAKPQVAIVTGVSTVHAEGFGSLDDILKEKMQLAESVDASGSVIVNADDVHLEEALGQVKATVSSYGFSETADVRVMDVDLSTRPDEWFDVDEMASVLTVTIRGQEERYVFKLKNRAGRPVGSTLAAAVTVAESFNVDSMHIVSSLSKLKATPGRLQLLPGIKGSLILDDSYNASPAAMRAAVETLADFDPVQGARRIAVLGSMGELGRYMEDEHRHVGFVAAEMGIDLLLCVGEPARDIARAAVEAGMKAEMVHEFETSFQAGRWLDQEIESGDVVLVKGSQSTRMEKVVKDIMAEPLRASELLVRQSKKWLES